MTLSEIKQHLSVDKAWEPKNCNPDMQGTELCYASDLISDLLTFDAPGAFLLTSLTNAQIIRSAEILELVGICFVRGKKPREDTLKLAREKEIPLYTTSLSMYEASGRLYVKGLKPARKTESVT
jgi:hypothetical protein